MLETIREYAGERQVSHEGEGASVRERHAEWVFSWGREFDARQDDQEAALARLRHELPNVRVALHELRTRGRLCDRLELATALAQGMFQLGAARESKSWLEETLAMSATCPDKLRTRALAEASIQAAMTGDAEVAVRHAADAAELVVGLDEPKTRGEVLLAASLAHWVLGRLAEAERLTTEALAYADETGNEALAGDLRNNLCYLALQTGKLQLAREMGETALADARRRADLHLTAGLLHNLSLVAIRSDALQEATQYLAEALKISRQHGLEDTLRHSLEGIAAVVARSGSYDLAATLLGRAASGDPLVGEAEAVLRGETEREARAALGIDAYAEWSEVGAALTLDEVATRAADWLAAADLESAT
jgi:tetratricopeptide (TPR) repeat protein